LPTRAQLVWKVAPEQFGEKLASGGADVVRVLGVALHRIVDERHGLGKHLRRHRNADRDRGAHRGMARDAVLDLGMDDVADVARLIDQHIAEPLARRIEQRKHQREVADVTHAAMFLRWCCANGAFVQRIRVLPQPSIDHPRGDVQRLCLVRGQVPIDRPAPAHADRARAG
jgi:hypothetical protein